MIEPEHPTLPVVGQCELVSIRRLSFFDQPEGETAETLGIAAANQCVVPGDTVVWLAPDCPPVVRRHGEHPGHPSSARRRRCRQDVSLEAGRRCRHDRELTRFVPLLFRAAGYAGWCILLDELELIGRYTPLQRALSYVWLGAWLGLEGAPRVPGIVTAYAITDDFAIAVINARLDSEKLPEPGDTHEIYLVCRALTYDDAPS